MPNEFKKQSHSIVLLNFIDLNIGLTCGFVCLQVTLKGAKDCVDAARKRIDEIVQDLENQVTIECVIEQQHHRTIMGTRGSKVQKICSDFDVQIKIPDRANKENGTNGNGEEAVNGVSNDIIRITGRADNCEAARQALINLVPVNIEVRLKIFTSVIPKSL